jgi:outer membrane protein insertion porin family
VNWGTKQSNAAINWMNPYFMDSLWRIGVDLSWSESSMQTNEFSSVTQGIIGRASYPLNPYLAFTTRYRLVREYTNVVNESGLTRRLPGATGTVSALSGSFSIDTTNKPWDPTSGLRSDLKCEVAGLGGTTQFVSVAWLNTFYMSVLPLGTIKYRLDFNFMQPWGNTQNIFQVPYQERFFLGGEQSVRGYVPFSLGPKFGRPVPQPLGGLSSGLASIEWSWKISKDWRIFAFIDAGTVTAEPWTLEWPWRMSYGVGITVPVFGQAPVTVGIGIPVNPADPEDVQRYFFQMGATF